MSLWRVASRLCVNRRVALDIQTKKTIGIDTNGTEFFCLEQWLAWLGSF
jgi:hypothetical protein